MKASRVQECGSMDMSKFGHSQTAKIKSKHPFVSSILLCIVCLICCIMLAKFAS